MDAPLERAKVVEAKAPLAIFVFMKRDEAISRLQQHEADLKRLGVEHLYMFGSTARDEAGDDSDVDLFLDHEKGKLGPFELIDVKERAASILTDIMTCNSLHPRLRKRIEEAAVLFFLMTERIVAPRLADIIEAIERIRRVLDGATLEAFEQDWEKRWLVERGIEIISKASRHLTDDIKERRPKRERRRVGGAPQKALADRILALDSASGTRGSA
jgi:predicted nucleotidyltransferase